MLVSILIALFLPPKKPEHTRRKHAPTRSTSFVELKAVRQLKTLPAAAAEHLDSYMGTNLLEAE